MYTKLFKHISKSNVPTAGGKGASLGELTQAGISVPPGFVILANAFDRFIAESHLKEEIQARLTEVNPADTNSVERASTILRDVIHDHPVPADLTAEIMAGFHELGAELVAVRSSATAEDSAIASWAGELETYLNTTEENIIERVKNCWSSLFTPRAIFYRHEKGLIDAQVSVAVVIQQMIQSEVSGIAFTVHPVTEDYDQMIIEAGFGLGEAIVSGQITPDSYIVSKSTMSILNISVSEQSKKLIKGTSNPRLGGVGVGEPLACPDSSASPTPGLRAYPAQAGIANSPLEGDGGGVGADTNHWVPLTESEATKQKLTGQQIVELSELCVKIEHHYGFPCDIEWAFANGKFYITQSRPITTLKR